MSAPSRRAQNQRTKTPVAATGEVDELMDAVPPDNPYGRRTWPYDDPTIRVDEAEALALATGARALADLLHADNEVRTDRDNADHPAREFQPLDERTRHGVSIALGSLLCQLERRVEAIITANAAARGEGRAA